MTAIAGNETYASVHRLLQCPEIFELLPSVLGNVIAAASNDDNDEFDADMNLQQIGHSVNAFGIKLLNQKKYLEAKALYELALQLQSDYNLFYYNLACAESLLGNAEEAIKQLSLAVFHGYSNVDHLECDPDFANIRHLPAFKVIVQQLRPTVPLVVPVPAAAWVPWSTLPEQVPIIKPTTTPPTVVVQKPAIVVNEAEEKKTPAEKEYHVELKQLEEMGFLDKNANVETLIICNGDLDQTITTLITNV
jgi:tetratricopeptide (TPR) repeat protein